MRPHPIAALAVTAALLGAGVAASAQDTPPLAVFACGDARVELRDHADGLLLRLGTEDIVVRQAPAASGARYEGAAAAGPVVFWDRGGRALLSLGPRTLPECARADAVPFRFRATGNEPFWLIEIVDDRLRFSPMGAPAPTEAILLPPRVTPDGTLHATQPGGPRLSVLVTPGPCRDTMSGVTFPDRVEVTHEGRTMSGCGSTPEGRLIGAAWTVESIGGEAAAGRRPVTLEFRAGGRFGGQGPCNVYMGGWTMPEGMLRIDRVASTMMACPEPMMVQERRMHAILQSARALRFGEDGSLTIEGGDGATLVARR